MRQWAILVLVVLAPPATAAVAPTVKAEAALRILLAASSLPIPASSSCYGIIPGVSRPKLGDFLATPLAGLDDGANRISGGCDGDRCRIRITHSAGEDIFSYDYRFRTVHGRLVPASLACFSTP